MGLQSLAIGKFHHVVLCNKYSLFLLAIIERDLGPSEKKITVGVFALAHEVQISIFMT